MKRGWRVTERPTVWLPRASGTTKKGKNWLFGFRYGRVVLGTWWRVRTEPAALLGDEGRPTRVPFATGGGDTMVTQYTSNVTIVRLS